MDAVVIKLEGGSDEDVQLMMQEPISDESMDEIKKKGVLPSSNGLAFLDICFILLLGILAKMDLERSWTASPSKQRR